MIVLEKKSRVLLKLFVILTIFLILLSTSELIYSYKNRPEIFARIPLLAASFYLRANNLNKTLEYISAASKYHIKQNNINYKKEIPYVFPENLTKVEFQTQEEILNMLSQKLPYALKTNYGSSISNMYYHIALILYNKGYKSEANSFFQSAMYLNPTLSFLHIELADFYFNNQEVEKGMEILNYCLTFDPPRKHCEEYISNNVQTNSFLSVGQLSEITDKYQIFK